MLSKFRARRPSLGTVLGTVALVVALSGMAVAAIPGSDGVVTACLSNNGSLKVIDAEAGQSCREGQTSLRLATTDSVGKVLNADMLDGKDSTDFLGATAKAADADKLDGKDWTDFLGATAMAADADLLDGMDSSAFGGPNAVSFTFLANRTISGTPTTIISESLPAGSYLLMAKVEVSNSATGTDYANITCDLLPDAGSSGISRATVTLNRAEYATLPLLIPHSSSATITVEIACEIHPGSGSTGIRSELVALRVDSIGLFP